MKNCIINYSEGQWYPRGQKRLVESLFGVGYTGNVLLFDWFLIERHQEKYQTEMGNQKCPSHEESPYAFKYWIFDYARKEGYDNVLWLDSSFWAIKSLQGIFNRITTIGYVLQKSDEVYLGNWCSDIALKTLNYSREKAFSMLMHDGGFIGLNMHNIKALRFLRQMIKYSLDGKSFQGAWTNEEQQVSNDKRVLGHRHDMAVGTMIADKLGMKAVPKGTYWIQVKQRPKYKKVCLLGEGM